MRQTAKQVQAQNLQTLIAKRSWLNDTTQIWWGKMWNKAQRPNKHVYPKLSKNHARKVESLQLTRSASYSSGWSSVGAHVVQSQVSCTRRLLIPQICHKKAILSDWFAEVWSNWLRGGFHRWRVIVCVLPSGHLTKSPPPSGWAPLPYHVIHGQHLAEKTFP